MSRLERSKPRRNGGGNIPALVELLKARDARLRSIEAKLAQPVAMPDRDALRAALRLRGNEWRDVLRGKHLQQARQVLAHLVELPIRIVSDPKPEWVTRARPHGLFSGVIHGVTSPTGVADQGWSLAFEGFSDLMKAA